jgi:hypothetical protein
MKTFSVGTTYTVWVEVEAESTEDAKNKATEVDHYFWDMNATGAEMVLNEFDDMIVEETFNV